MVTPAGTPRAINLRIHDDMLRILRTPEVVQLVRNTGYEITGTSPEKLGEIIRDESRQWAQVIREAGIKPE
jgi:tripartite-type tricarboxylate transporter receptor subunit TctC